VKQTNAVGVVILLLLTLVWGCDDDPTATSTPMYSEVADSSFVVGNSSVVLVNNFVGNVTVRTGLADTITVVVTRWAGRVEDLSKIDVELTEVTGGVRVVTDNPLQLSNVSVDLVVTAPPDMQPDIRNGVGGTSYEGRAGGVCRFSTGVGSITLRLPADVNVEVDLSAGVGSVSVGFPVVGQVSQHVVIGTIGTGMDGEIHAQVATGSIAVVSQNP
jgi:hypothetical protein